MKSNNFDFLRLCAATAVIWSHVPPLLGIPGNRGDFGAAGVFAFFAISGYLVTESWDRDPNALRFALRRAMRILPGLAVVVLLSALVMGPILSELPPKIYFADPTVLGYCRNIFLFPLQFGLPGVFLHNPVKWVVNGSLWTLPMEVMMYFGLMAIGSLRLWKMPVITFCLGMVSVLAVEAFYQSWTVPPGSIPAFLPSNIPELVDVTVCFLTGAVLAKAKGRIPLVSWSWVPIIAACYFIHPHPVERLLLVFGIPYATISFAVKPTPIIRSAGRFGDFSYGIYIYAFPIMQMIVMFHPKIGPVGFAFLSIALSVGAGAISWWLVESRALKLRANLPPLLRGPVISADRLQPAAIGALRPTSGV